MSANSPVRQRILIVDDVPDNISFLAAVLDGEYETQFALSGEQALDLVAQAVPDLVLLDVMMPGMSGLETLERLRGLPGGNKLPVILITADTRTTTHIEGLRLGAQDFLTKPVEVPVLLARIHNALERRRLEGEAQALTLKLTAANHELKRLVELNAVLLASAGEGIFSVDLTGTCTSVNPAALKLLGYTEEEVLGQNQHVVFHHHRPNGMEYPSAECPIFQTLRDGVVRRLDEHFIRKDGTMLPVLLTVTPMMLDGTRVGAEVLFQDISERQRMERELFRLATTDVLTGILNRRRFLELGEAEQMRVARYGTDSALLMLDLDHFKNVNDRYGHSVGDEVLRSFAREVTGLLRTVDVFGRLGGEEFAVLLPETDTEGAVVFAERLRNAVAAMQVPVENGAVGITVSIGIAKVCAGGASLDQVLVAADRALYRAKESGRNQTVLADPNEK